MSAAVEFRKATLADHAAVCTLGQEVNRLHHEAWPHVFAATPSCIEQYNLYWYQILLNDNSRTFVAEIHTRVVGFATGDLIDERNPYLQPIRVLKANTLSVTAAYQGQGLGRTLLAQLEQWGREQGAVEARLNVWKFNASAVRLYQTTGYEARSFNMAKPLLKAE